MEAFIAIDESSRVGFAFLPGQRITGKVMLRSEESEEYVDGLVIMFRGVVTIEVPSGEGNIVRKTVTLFCYRQSLLEKSLVLKSLSVFAKPFEFVAPRTIKTRNLGKSAAECVEYRLPPSLSRSYTSAFSPSCEIHYELKLIINGRELMEQQDIVVQLPFAVRLKAPPRTARAEAITLGDVYHDGEMSVTKARHLRRKLSVAFQKEPQLNCPAIYFRAEVHMPRHMSADQSFPLSFSIKVSRFAPREIQDSDDPNLRITRLDLTLSAQEFFCIHGLNATNRILVGKMCFDFTPKELPHDGTPVLIDENVSLPAAPTIDGTPVADFKTPLVSRSHQLCVKAIIQHVESGHNFEIEREIYFEILSRYLEVDKMN